MAGARKQAGTEQSATGCPGQPEHSKFLPSPRSNIHPSIHRPPSNLPLLIHLTDADGRMHCIFSCKEQTENWEKGRTEGKTRSRIFWGKKRRAEWVSKKRRAESEREMVLFAPIESPIHRQLQSEPKKHIHIHSTSIRWERPFFPFLSSPCSHSFQSPMLLWCDGIVVKSRCENRRLPASVWLELNRGGHWTGDAENWVSWLYGRISLDNGCNEMIWGGGAH